MNRTLSRHPFHASFRTFALALATAGAAGAALAHGPQAHGGGLASAPDAKVVAPFDIIHTKVTVEGRIATFHMAVSGKAGARKPARRGKMAGSGVFAYVWPTSLDPAVVGFEAGAGKLALAVTAHPDFDDTPLYDENNDGRTDNDGAQWHSHWVVLQPDAACGPGALKVADIPEGSKPRLPKTWPGVPLLLDSPGYSPIFKGPSVDVRVPFDDIEVVRRAAFDGVTAGLRIDGNLHSPLLCVVDVFKVASGDLSLPGRVAP